MKTPTSADEEPQTFEPIELLKPLNTLDYLKINIIFVIPIF